MRLLRFTKCSRLSSKCFRLEVDESGKQWREKREGDSTQEIGYGEKTGFTRTLYVFVKKEFIQKQLLIVLYPYFFLKEEEARSRSDKTRRVSFRYLQTVTACVRKSFLYFQGSPCYAPNEEYASAVSW